VSFLLLFDFVATLRSWFGSLFSLRLPFASARFVARRWDAARASLVFSCGKKLAQTAPPPAPTILGRPAGLWPVPVTRLARAGLEGERTYNWNFGNHGRIALAFVAGAPIAYYCMQHWLAQYTYRTRLSWWIFAGAGVGAILLSLLTVSTQAIRAAVARPMDSLRSE
jgi:hypothetical protein